ncbi:MAG: hypothetical protein ACJ764_03765 [Solirubrobacteraceae bacterium]
MVAFELSGSVYNLTDVLAIVLAERLRNYAKGAYPEEVKWACELSGNGAWVDGALAAADFIEEALVGNINEPLPLEGKAAEATFWTLRLLPDLREPADAADAAALREALGTIVPAPRAAA